MWDFGMTYCRTPVVVQPIIYLTPLSSEQIHRWSPCTIPVINASVACESELPLYFYLENVNVILFSGTTGL